MRVLVIRITFPGLLSPINIGLGDRSDTTYVLYIFRRTGSMVKSTLSAISALP